MSLNISELKATITIDTGRLQVELERLKDALTGRGFILKRWAGKMKYNKILKACDRAAYECAVDLMKEAVAQTPIDTGALRKSAYVARIGKGETAGYEIGYDRNNSQNIRDKYGIIQHETLWFNHPKGGKAKFLEDPYNANLRRYISIIKHTLKEEI